MGTYVSLHHKNVTAVLQMMCDMIARNWDPLYTYLDDIYCELTPWARQVLMTYSLLPKPVMLIVKYTIMTKVQ